MATNNNAAPAKATFRLILPTIPPLSLSMLFIPTGLQPFVAAMAPENGKQISIQAIKNLFLVHLSAPTLRRHIRSFIFCQENNTMQIPLMAIASALVIHTLWGGNPVAVKLGLVAFPPLWSAFIRFAIGALCIAGWAYINKIRLWPERREWRGLCTVALIFTVQISMMNLGINLTSGASAAVMTATFPLFAGLFAHFMIAGDRLTPGKVAGLLTAFLGVGVVLTGGRIPQEFSSADFGDLIILASTVLLGARMVWTARLVSNIEPTRLVFWMMLLSLGVFAAGAVMWEEINWGQVGWLPIGALAYQGVVIAGLGFMVNTWLLKRYSPSVMISFGFISPISGVLLSALLLGDALTWDLAAGTALVGIGLIILARRAQARSPG
jgi:drug/metabolite transporter (DMT)-like permease